MVLGACFPLQTMQVHRLTLCSPTAVIQTGDMAQVPTAFTVYLNEMNTNSTAVLYAIL